MKKLIFGKINKMAENVVANVSGVFKAGYKTNAFAPLVWFNAVADPSLFFAAKFSEANYLKIIFVILLCIILISSLVAYFYMLFKKPDLLQSERFRIEDKKLNLIASKGSDIIISPVNLTTPLLNEGDDNN
jgi:hypothetical protein